VINPPQAGILAIGSLRQAAVVRENQIVPRWMMTANLSVDHRAVDGVHVATFMQELRTLLENPFSLALEAPEEEAN
jgi:pyruvate dehydrogenase E2 component (dihydrolipoamide acetyltransferase)